MMHRTLPPSCRSGLTLLLLCLLGAGCGSSPPTRFYVLTAVDGEPGGAATHSTAIGVGPVSLPAYLDRPQMITRRQDTDIELAEFDRWAEPLAETFIRVLGENLSTLVPTDRVHLYPWGVGAQLDYELTLDVARFEIVAPGTAELAARWTLVRREGGKTVALQRSRFSVPAAGEEPSEHVAALSEALAQLAREVADVIRKQ